jgi:hypothetical protein
MSNLSGDGEEVSCAKTGSPAAIRKCQNKNETWDTLAGLDGKERGDCRGTPWTLLCFNFAASVLFSRSGPRLHDEPQSLQFETKPNPRAHRRTAKAWGCGAPDSPCRRSSVSLPTLGTSRRRWLPRHFPNLPPEARKLMGNTADVGDCLRL